jgi:hypothetical protein
VTGLQFPTRLIVPYSTISELTMSSFLACLFRNCIEHGRRSANSSSRSRATTSDTSCTYVAEEEDHELMSGERIRHNLLAPSSSRRRNNTEQMRYIAENGPPRRSSLIRGLEGADSEEEEEDFEEQDEGDCHHLSSGDTVQPDEQQWLILGGTLGFLRRISVGTHPSYAPSSSGTALQQCQLNPNIFFSNTPIKQVKEAKTFILSGERGKDSYPSISFDEIVLPGSEVQRAMAKQMQVEMDLMMEEPCCLEECVICMDGFTPDNPRMPTLCGCGENKTYFHLPCLYQWIDQGGRNCPSCRQKLVWEEF